VRRADVAGASAIAVYGEGRYLRRIRYHEPCDPPLPPADRQWADERLAAFRAARPDLFPR
jgi:hypothetical protein